MKLALALIAGVALAAGSAQPQQPPAAQPAAPQAQATRGVITLGDGALAYVPARLPAGPAPLLILLHGAGGRAVHMIDRFRAEADRSGIVLLAPKSAGLTWDAIRGGARRDRRRAASADTDPPRIEAALARLRNRVAVDPRRVALGGFSDGASYALTIAPLRPDLYGAILAFSPGMMIRLDGRRGHQDVFLSHGRSDRILPFANAADRLVPILEGHRHRVTFRPFDGGHEVPDEMIRQGVAAWLGRGR